MQPITPKKLLLFDICIIVSTITAILITWWSLSIGIYDVFPFFYIIPLVLIAFAHPKLEYLRDHSPGLGIPGPRLSFRVT